VLGYQNLYYSAGYPPDVYKAVPEASQDDPNWDKHMSSPEAVDE
jgi:hypothetical protein